MNIVKERAGNLAASQLKKYDWRVELFIGKCEKEGEVTLAVTGEKVRIDSKGIDTRKTVEALEKYLKGEEDFRGSYSINTEDGRTIRISSIEKSSEFGGGAGVAGGSDQTKIVEAGQCVKCANGEEWRVSLGKGVTIEKIEQDIEELDETWKTCLDSTGKALQDRLGKGYWHWQDTFVKSIEEFYSNCTDKLPGKFDRYNPADIWYTSKPYESIQEIEDFSLMTTENSKEVSLENLSNILNTAYGRKEVIGISLKKTLKPDVVEYSKDKRDSKIVLNNIIINKRAERSLTMLITFDMNGEKYICEIRRDATSYRALLKKRVQGGHYDGSVGKGIILKCLGKICSEEDTLNSFNPNFTLLEDRQEFFHRDGSIMTAREQAIARSLDNIADYLIEAGEEAQKEFLGRLVRYAWSMHTKSCTFLKVC